MTSISWDEIYSDSKALANSIQLVHNIDICVGLLRGGCIPATIISHQLNIPMFAVGIKSYNNDHTQDNIEHYQKAGKSLINYIHNTFKHSRGVRCLVVDDLSDSGTTFKYFNEMYEDMFESIISASLYIKSGTGHVPDFYQKEFNKTEWLEFPWEC